MKATSYTYKRPWLYKRQLEAIFHDQRYGLCEASTKAGKTIACIVWLFEQALRGKAGDNYWWVAPIYPQAKIAYRRLKRFMPRWLCKSNESELTITLPTGAVIWFKSADNPDSLYGEDVKAAVGDEASRWKDDSWFALRSTLTATRGMVRLIGNVKGRKNFFYQLCRKAEAGAPDMRYAVITAYDAVEGGVMAAEEVEDAKRNLPEHIFNELYLCKPSDDGGNPFGLDAIRRCVAPLSNHPVAVWGIDLAKSHDWTVAIGLDDLGSVAKIERWQSPWIETEQRILRLVGSGVPALVDSTGVGDPIVEGLNRKNGFIEGFKFTSQSKQQLMEGLAVAIQTQAICYPEGVITIELEQFEYEYSRNGVKYSAPSGAHDDTVCALALANALRMRPKAIRPTIRTL
jgi:phage FluMu gp28-like protein